ncbi:metallophosphoesterase family protein [Halospeciosus flavus]|uniref:Phosphoesterase n=1 Tax=Halospeciosus flavus TaxID=3032283 RepID=A0ABD5Z6Z8_9EURY|nr:metallophosphoesterase family protein [Halospeciosus flavus]
MPRLAIVSDTHIPSRADAIPEWVEAEVAAADHVVHAGDFDSHDALETVEDLVDGEFTAVHGNIEPKDIGLPTTTSVTVGGQEFVVTHGSGAIEGYRDRVADIVREEAETSAPIGVSGHTHDVLDTVHDGVRLLNPGSATGADPAEERTMMRVDVETGAEGDVGAGIDVEVLRG